MASYNKYATMTSEMKDKLVEGEEFVQKIKAYNLRSNQRVNDQTYKRTHSGEHEVIDNDEPNLNSNPLTVRVTHDA